MIFYIIVLTISAVVISQTTSSIALISMTTRYGKPDIGATHARVNIVAHLLTNKIVINTLMFALGKTVHVIAKALS